MYKLYRIAPLGAFYSSSRRLVKHFLQALAGPIVLPYRGNFSLRDPNTPDDQTVGKKQSACDLSTEPITEVLTFSIHCSTSGQITLKADTSLTLRFYRRSFNRNIMEKHATRSSTLALSCQTCFGNDGCRSRLRNPWGIAWRPGRTEDVGGEFLARAQCGMSVDQADVVVESLLLLNHEFPDDSKVLYITSRYYSELANRAARKLTVRAPSSAEAQVLMAEAYQARGDFESATAKYRRILEQYPKQPGVHYQLGQIILAKIPTATEEAKREFDAELEVNPTSPAAEYMLGDLAWRAMKSDEAIPHFSRATELDVSLAQPYLGLGVALNAVGRFTEAIDALKQYIRLTPADPRDTINLPSPTHGLETS